jgi:hypothetical protein
MKITIEKLFVVFWDGINLGVVSGKFVRNLILRVKKEEKKRQLYLSRK